MSLAKVGHDKTVRIWNAATGECHKKIDEEGGGHEKEVLSVGWLPDSKRFVTGGNDSSMVRRLISFYMVILSFVNYLFSLSEMMVPWSLEYEAENRLKQILRKMSYYFLCSCCTSSLCAFFGIKPLQVELACSHLPLVCGRTTSCNCLNCCSCPVPIKSVVLVSPSSTLSCRKQGPLPDVWLPSMTLQSIKLGNIRGIRI